MNKIIDHFDRRAKEFEKNSEWSTNEYLLNESLDYLHSQKSQIVCLDCGGGTGVVPRYSLNFNCNEWYLIDLNQNMLNQCNGDQIIKINGDIHNTIFRDDFFDYIYIRQVLHYIELSKAFDEIKRIIKANGIITVVQKVYPRFLINDWHSELINIRQPLRNKYWIDDELIQKLSDERLSVISTKTISIHRKKDLQKWLTRANTLDKNTVEKQKEMLASRPQIFKDNKYYEISNSNIEYQNYWQIINCAVNK